jgi:hypothetical protein
MIDWAEPKSFKEWSQRVLGLRPVLVTLLVFCVIVLEMRFDWMERVIGVYLMTTNSVRPESGAIWEKGHQARTAQKTLEKIVTDRQISQREARSAESFSQIAASLSPGQGVMMSVDRFRNLYLQLPQAVSQEVISAFDLLKISSNGRWRRTYFENSGTGLIVYLLDGENRVLHRIDVSVQVLNRLDPESSAAVDSLEELPNFKNRIYPAERFFTALDTFDEELRLNMLPYPEMLLKQTGQIVRVGISDEAVAGFIELGFEILNGGQRMVVLVQGHEWAIWRLRSHLEDKNPSKQTFIDLLENRLPK